MKPLPVRRAFIARPWLIVVGLLAAIAGVTALLWISTRPPATRDSSEELVIYCATGMLSPVRQVAADYEKEYHVKVRIETDSSGSLLSKLRLAGDRVDLYLAGEESFVREAARYHLVAEILPVARQHVVIGVAPGNPLKIADLKDLHRDDVRVVLPNPELTATAKAVQRALAGTGQWEALLQRQRTAKLPMPSVGNVKDAAEKVKLGAADAALVWDAVAREFGLEVVEVPEFQAVAADQATLAVVAASTRPTAALRFARYLTARDRGEQVLAKNHFQPLDDADVWSQRPELLLMSGAMLKPGVDGLLKSFEEREGVSITPVYNGCGILVSQMKATKAGRSGAAAHFPDAYFSCDVSFMRQVQQWFEAAKVVSRNDIVMVVPKGNPKQVKSIEDLTRPELRLGLAHPKNSALGALFDDILKKLNLREKVYDAGRKQPVVHADAGHALVNQMRAGALDLIVVYRSNVMSNPENAEKYLDVVELNLPEAIARQPYAVAKDSRHKYLMRRLLAAILSPASKEHFIKSGFQWIADQEP
jgi:ABC-type molybdate transport system substrate-binding protein